MKRINKGCFEKNSLYFFTIVALLLVCGCKPNIVLAPQKTLTNQEWYVKNIHYGKNSRVSNISYYVVRFYPNETFALFSGTGFSFGQWRMVTKKLVQLHPNFGNIRLEDLFWEMEEQFGDNLTMGLYQQAVHDPFEKDITIRFTGLTNVSSKDPFLLAENLWRKKPLTSETDDQIKKRVLSYLHFLEALYQHTVDNKLDALRYDWFPEPMRMEYGNAVRMAYSGEEMMLWNKCFYDSAQAVKAYLLIGNTMIKQELKSTDNIAERNLEFVKEMEETLKR